MMNEWLLSNGQTLHTGIRLMESRTDEAIAPRGFDFSSCRAMAPAEQDATLLQCREDARYSRALWGMLRSIPPAALVGAGHGQSWMHAD